MIGLNTMHLYFSYLNYLQWKIIVTRIYSWEGKTWGVLHTNRNYDEIMCPPTYRFKFPAQGNNKKGQIAICMSYMHNLAHELQ
jgi:hypothetical protein